MSASGPSPVILAILPRSSGRDHGASLIHSPPYFRFIRPHYGWRRWRKGVRKDASWGWVSGCEPLPTHCYRLESKGCPPVQAMHDHFSACWTLLRFGWTGGFGAPLNGSPPGLSDKTPLFHGWVWPWSCNSQKAEKCYRPGTVHNKDHSPGDREVHGQPGVARAPPVAPADRNQGRRQGSLPWCPDYPQRPLWTGGRRVCWMLYRSTEVVPGHATLPAQPLQLRSCFQLPWVYANSAAHETCTGHPAATQPSKIQQMRGRSHSARHHPFPKRQGPWPKITLNPAPPPSSWSAEQEEKRDKSHHGQTTSQTTSLTPPTTPFNSGCGGKCVCCKYRSPYKCPSNHPLWWCEK